MLAACFSSFMRTDCSKSRRIGLAVFFTSQRNVLPTKIAHWTANCSLLLCTKRPICALQPLYFSKKIVKNLEEAKKSLNSLILQMKSLLGIDFYAILDVLLQGKRISLNLLPPRFLPQNHLSEWAQDGFIEIGFVQKTFKHLEELVADP